MVGALLLRPTFVPGFKCASVPLTYLDSLLEGLTNCPRRGPGNAFPPQIGAIHCLGCIGCPCLTPILDGYGWAWYDEQSIFTHCNCTFVHVFSIDRCIPVPCRPHKQRGTRHCPEPLPLSLRGLSMFPLRQESGRNFTTADVQRQAKRTFPKTAFNPFQCTS